MGPDEARPPATPIGTRHTLVLNRSYEPLRVIHWQRAITLQLTGRVELLAVYDAFVHSPTRAFPLPAVVRLERFVRHRDVGARFSRRNIFLRDAFTCQYCGIVGTEDTLTFDHVVPRARGGITSWNNIVTACARCNRRKGDRTPDQAGLILRSPPSRPPLLPFGRDAVLHSETPAEWQLYLRAA